MFCIFAFQEKMLNRPFDMSAECRGLDICLVCYWIFHEKYVANSSQADLHVCVSDAVSTLPASPTS